MKNPGWASSPVARKIMQANRSKDTEPELAIRRAVHALGLRYQVSVRPLPGVRRSVDILFPRVKVAVFVDGCFWHGCPEHYREPASNVEFWRHKVARNRARDLETTELFRLSGWVVLRFWAHDDPVLAADEIRRAVGQRRYDIANSDTLPDQGTNGAAG